MNRNKLNFNNNKKKLILYLQIINFYKNGMKESNKESNNENKRKRSDI